MVSRRAVLQIRQRQPQILRRDVARKNAKWLAATRSAALTIRVMSWRARSTNAGCTSKSKRRALRSQTLDQAAGNESGKAGDQNCFVKTHFASQICHEFEQLQTSISRF